MFNSGLEKEWYLSSGRQRGCGFWLRPTPPRAGFVNSPIRFSGGLISWKWSIVEWRYYYLRLTGHRPKEIASMRPDKMQNYPHLSIDYIAAMFPRVIPSRKPSDPKFVLCI